MTDALFDVEPTSASGSLADRFGAAPLSVLDRRSGSWQARRREWLALGIQSEKGRDISVDRYSSARQFAAPQRTDFLAQKTKLNAGGVSLFCPVLAETAYRWLTRPGDDVLDPFAGGAVRGVVASAMGRRYVGVDLSGNQVAANQEQSHLGHPDTPPRWHVGDAAEIDMPDRFDFAFTCPPYGSLERYSDHPRDLSTMTSDDFDAAHAQVIRRTADHLRDDRFAAWVMSDVRDHDRGWAYRGLVGKTIAAFTAAGMTFESEAIILDPIGPAAMRAARSFRATRRLTRVHQHLLIFVKGNAQRAARRLETDA